MRLEQELDLITQKLQGLYDAECQLVLALPRVAKRACNPELGRALREHLEETRTHAKRLEQACAALGVPCRGVVCFAMQGLLKEGDEALGYGGEDSLVDAAIIASCQAVEHFEISQYGLLVERCTHGGSNEVAQFLKQTLHDEDRASQTLARIGSESLRTGAAPSTR